MNDVYTDLRNLLLNNRPSILDQDELDYKQLGTVWEEIVHSHLDNHEIEVLSAIGLTRSEVVKISFSHVFTYPTSILLPGEERKYGIFDVLITTIPELPDYILEVKLNPGNIGLKELKYLYYRPDAVLVGIFFFPSSIKFPEQIFKSKMNELENLFNLRYHPVKPFSLEKSRLIMLGSEDIGIQDMSVKNLRKYLDRRTKNISRFLFLIYMIYPKYLIMKDLTTILDLYHNYVRRIIRILHNYGIVELLEGDTIDNRGRVVDSTKFYRAKSKFMSEKGSLLINDLVEHYSISIPEYKNYGRNWYPKLIRQNDHSILCYLSHFPGWISIPDLLDNVNFSSQGEMRRRLAALLQDGQVETSKGYLIDILSSRTKSYAAHFYKLTKSYHHDECSSNQETPTRRRIPIELSRNELLILLFLKQHHLCPSKPIAISDIATSLNIGPSTVLQAVNRLTNRDDIPIFTTQKWVLSYSKRTSLRSSPVVYIKDYSVDEDNYIENLPDLEIPDLVRNLIIMDVPLTPNERSVLDAIADGVSEIDDLLPIIKLNKIPKSNRSMVTAVIKRLADKNQMAKRNLQPLLCTSPLRLTSFAQSIL